MNISARNQLRSRVKRIEIGAVNAESFAGAAGGLELVSIITKASAEQLDLTPDKKSMPLSKRAT
jgi:molybdopterin-binding protein